MIKLLMPFIDIVLAGLGGVVLVLLGMLKYKNESIKSKDKIIKDLEIDKEIMKENVNVEKFDAKFVNPLKEINEEVEKANKKESNEKIKFDNSSTKYISV